MPPFSNKYFDNKSNDPNYKYYLNPVIYHIRLYGINRGFGNLEIVDNSYKDIAPCDMYSNVEEDFKEYVNHINTIQIGFMGFRCHKAELFKFIYSKESPYKLIDAEIIDSKNISYEKSIQLLKED